MGEMLYKDPVLILALQEVTDPEFPISIVDMGLIYGVEKQGNTAYVTMTYTSTGCGCMQWIESDIKKGCYKKKVFMKWKLRWFGVLHGRSTK